MSYRPDDRPEHPGTRLKQLLLERGLSQTDLAFILGQSGTGINLIIANKRGISPDMSKALGEALGLEPRYFSDLQTEYDLARAADPDPSVGIRANLLLYPIREMIKRGWLSDTSPLPLREQLARFLALDDPNGIPYLAHSAKRTSYEERSISPAQIAWLFRVRQIAKMMPTPTYTHRSLEASLQELRAMLTAPEAARHVPRILMASGVRFVMVESLPKAKIDGVAFWLDSHCPVIGLSGRYDRIDSFWFTLRHEIEHILRGHGLSDEMVDAELEGANACADGDLPSEELLANAAAADFCVPTDKLRSFIERKRPFYYERDVLAFAALHNTHPGIVVGQMQRILNRYDYLKRHQVRIRQFVLPGAIADGWGQSVPPLQGAR